MRRLLLVVVAMPMFAVAGCSGSPSAGETPSPTQLDIVAPASSSTPAATPSSAAPVHDLPQRTLPSGSIRRRW